MKIIRERERITVQQYERSFTWVDHPDGGFSFPCDAEGTVDVSALFDFGRENYQKCIDGTYNVIDNGAVLYEHTYTLPAVLLCICGETVHLEDALYNMCTCRRFYNLVGQPVRPPQMYYEDTGETYADLYNDREDY